jgi:hypothetical protein
MCLASRRLRSIPATPEVFDHDRAVAAHQAGGELAQVLAAGVRDSGVQCRDTGLGLAPPRRGDLPGPPIRADTAGRLTRQATQLTLGDLHVAWVGDDLTGREHRQVVFFCCSAACLVVRHVRHISTFALTLWRAPGPGR